jgi:hypothetical protein
LGCREKEARFQADFREQMMAAMGEDMVWEGIAEVVVEILEEE